MNGRIELHTESRFSENLSCLSEWDIAKTAKKHDCAAVAITDLNSVYSYSAAERELSERHIRIIYGITISCIDNEDRYDVVLLSKNLVGRNNIFRLAELLYKNEPLLGRAVTRKQLDAHRDGTLIGAAAHNGQLIRALQHRRGQRYLDKIIRDYDYIEFTPEPYDISAEIFQLAQTHEIPLCAVQYAVLNDDADTSEYHAYRALNEYYLTDASPVYWRSASELKEEIETLYVLPREKDIAHNAVFDAPAKILEQIEDIPPLSDVLAEGQILWHQALMPELQEIAAATLEKKFGTMCPTAVKSRIETEMALIDKYHAAPIFSYLSTLADTTHSAWCSALLSGVAANSELLHLWGLSTPDPMPRHIWCSACGYWEEIQLPLGTVVNCPHCGQPASVSGIDLPAKALRGVLGNGGNIEFRVTDKVSRFLQEKLDSYKNAVILQPASLNTEDPSPIPSADDVANAYLEKRPEIGGLRGNGAFFSCISQHIRGQTRDPSLYLRCLFPRDHLERLPCLPVSQQSGDHYHTLLDLWNLRTLPRILIIDHCGFELLMDCETVTGIPASSISVYSQEIYDALTKAVNDPASKGTSVELSCCIFGISPHRKSELAESRALFDDGAEDFIPSIFHSMPLRDYEDLYRIWNLACNAGAWFGPAKEALEQGLITPSQVLCCREDVLDYLARRGCPYETAFEIMEYVRIGKASAKRHTPPDTCFLPRHWDALQACGAEDWFLESCRKIEYLFPRGHGAAMADCLAKLVWYAIYTPKETEEVFKKAAEQNGF